MRSSWCNTCRGPAENARDLIKCQSCPKRFHLECCGDDILQENGGSSKIKTWQCLFCVREQEDEQDDEGGENSEPKTKKKKSAASMAKEVTTKVNKYHRDIRSNTCHFFHRERKSFSFFLSEGRLDELSVLKNKNKKSADINDALVIGSSEPYIHASLRSYQVDGINWMLSQYQSGVGGIMADEMGLGKTIQTLGFLAKLKESGLSGPHLIVTPLAVLQNWQNEAKRFVPDMSVVKIHGSQSERDLILTNDEVLSGSFDIYLTTYETICNEEAFFSEQFKFHTIVIDEGQRLKNSKSKLCQSLERVHTPFRLILTGTPLQNNLGELWALIKYILPKHLGEFDEVTESLDDKTLDCNLVQSCRSLLESLMIRRVKSEVEKSLLPKLQYILKVPLSDLQRQWYQIIQSKQIEKSSLLTHFQMLATISQLQKIINHPKCILYSHERVLLANERKIRSAQGSEFINLSNITNKKRDVNSAFEEGIDQSELLNNGTGSEAELRSLKGLPFIQASGKLQLLDRLLDKVLAEKSRVLLFSQYTLALDILTEYATAKFGAEGVGYLRLDGETNRIKKEMDVRAFNAPNSTIPIYLISTKAGGVGINLATADVVILYDTCYNPQVDLQAQDRAHRIGQTKQVKVYRLIAESTVEESILNRSRRKLVLDELVIKKKGEVSALSHKFISAEEETTINRQHSDDNTNQLDANGVAELPLAELWTYLSIGYKKKFVPKNKGERRALSDEELDEIIDNGQLQQSIDEAKQDIEVPEIEMKMDIKNENKDEVEENDDDENEFMSKNIGKDFKDKDGTKFSFVEITSSDESENETSSKTVVISGKRARKKPKLFTPPKELKRTGIYAKVKLQHEDYCFTCQDGGDLIECSLCPKVYHATEECSFMEDIPSGTWRCPWHNCFTCERSSSNCGGMLFHCIGCPVTYCFDCCPQALLDEQSIHQAEIIRTKRRLARNGCPSLKAKTFFKCPDCVQFSEENKQEEINESESSDNQYEEYDLCNDKEFARKKHLRILSSDSEQENDKEENDDSEDEDEDDSYDEEGNLRDHMDEDDEEDSDEESSDEENSDKKELVHKEIKKRPGDHMDEDDEEDSDEESSDEKKLVHKEIKKRLVPYYCGKCGLPKNNHICAFKNKNITLDGVKKRKGTKNKDFPTKKKNRDVNAPKPCRSAYLCFCDGIKPELKKTSPDLTSAQRDQRLREMWKELNEDSRAVFMERATMDIQRYDKEMKEYVPSSGGDAKKKDKYDPNAPKRPKNSYILWSATVRETAKAENPGANSTEIGQILGAKWKLLTDEEKEPFKLKAVEAKKKYEEEMKEYVPKNDVNAPKPCRSAYLCFCDDMKLEFKKTSPDLTSIQVDQKLGEIWKELNEDSRAVFMERATMDIQRYNKEMEEYVPLHVDGSKKDKKDPNAPKRSSNSYTLWSATVREKVKADNLEATSQEIGKLLGAKWKLLTDEEKEPFTLKFAEAKEKYEKEMKDYVSKKDVNTPKPCKSAYLYFCDEIKPKLKKTSPNLTSIQMDQKLGEMWKELNEDSRAVFMERATMDIQRYNKEMEEYVPSHVDGSKKDKKDPNVPKSKKDKKKKDPNAPKRSQNAFILWSTTVRETAKAENPGANTIEIGQILGAKWKLLTDEEKEPFTLKFAEAKEKYEEEMKDYNNMKKGMEQSSD